MKCHDLFPGSGVSFAENFARSVGRWGRLYPRLQHGWHLHWLRELNHLKWQTLYFSTSAPTSRSLNCCKEIHTCTDPNAPSTFHLSVQLRQLFTSCSYICIRIHIQLHRHAHAITHTHVLCVLKSACLAFELNMFIMRTSLFKYTENFTTKKNPKNFR